MRYNHPFHIETSLEGKVQAMSEKNYQLSDQELSQTAGGAPSMDSSVKMVYFYNSHDDQIGYRHGVDDYIHYVPCDKCGKPMHNGWFGWYCDPCNRHLVCVSYYRWYGSVEELKAAAG